MSALTRWLEWDRERPDIGGGSKTPAFVEVPVHPSMDTVIVSTPSGAYRVIDRSDREESFQRAGSFDLEPDVEAEDREQGRLAAFLFSASAKRDWGNAASREELDDGFVEDVGEYFDAFGLQLHAIHGGLEGCRSLVEAGLVEGPSWDIGDPTEGRLSELMENEYAIGKMDGKPVFFNRHMGPHLLFSADPEYVGIGIRIRERAAVVLHNPERGVVVARVEG